MLGTIVDQIDTTFGRSLVLDVEFGTTAPASLTGHNQAGDRPALQMNAGHDLTTDNLPPLRHAISDLAGVSIGHGLTADSLLIGFPAAVRRCLAALDG
jgi:pyridoxine 5-phosphate synthase